MSHPTVLCSLVLVPVPPAVQVGFAGACVAALGRFGYHGSRVLSHARGVAGSDEALVSVVARWCIRLPFCQVLSSVDIVPL